VFGFDSFLGLPEDWRPGCARGAFSLGGAAPLVSHNVRLVKGWFNETLAPFLAWRAVGGPAERRVALAHLDADLYSSTILVLRTLAPLVRPGTLLVFDELINYPGFEEHEWRALLEAAHEFGWGLEFVARVRPHHSPVLVENAASQQVAVRITSVSAELSAE
jgi:hypothetical protein